MHLRRYLLPAALLLLLPLSVSAFVGPIFSLPGISTGGRVFSVVPCLVGPIPALQIGVVSSRATTLYAPEFYIWMLPPAPTGPVITKTVGFGPPVRIGQRFLGIAGLPSLCFTPTAPPVPLFGLILHAVGSSNPAGL